MMRDGVMERPLPLKAPMVLATMSGAKTQVRSVIKKQPVANNRGRFDFSTFTDDEGIESFWQNGPIWWARCPYGKPGDRLWLRETWQHSNFPSGPYDVECEIFYRADYLDDPHGPDGERSPEGRYRFWRPSIHMPRAACRILLEVVSVRVERLNDCSEVDALAEGVALDMAGSHFIDAGNARHATKVGAPAVDAFKSLWESTSGAGSWAVNPWVWAIEFRRVMS